MDPTNPKTTADDPSAVVKAAAWAWYHRGSGASEASDREYDATRRRGHATPRPSRYKLEAMRLNNKAPQQEQRSTTIATTTTCPSLLDAYEIESISRHLDKLIAHAGDRDSAVFSDDDEVSVASFSSSSSSFSSKVKRVSNVLGMKRAVRGIWLRHAAAVCGARDGGVAEMAVVAARRPSGNCVGSSLS